MSGSRTRVRRTSPRRPSHSPRPACITVSNHPQSSRRAREQLKSGGIYDTKWNLKEEIEMLSRPVMIYPETDTNKAMKIWLPSQLPCPGKKGKGMDGEDPFQVKSLENEPQIPEPTTLKNPPTWSVITSNKKTPYIVYIYIYSKNKHQTKWATLQFRQQTCFILDHLTRSSAQLLYALWIVRLRFPRLPSWARGPPDPAEDWDGRITWRKLKTVTSFFLLKCTRTLFFFTLETEMDAIDAMPCRASFGFEKIRWCNPPGQSSTTGADLSHCETSPQGICHPSEISQEEIFAKSW